MAASIPLLPHLVTTELPLASGCNPLYTTHFWLISEFVFRHWGLLIGPIHAPRLVVRRWSINFCLGGMQSSASISLLLTPSFSPQATLLVVGTLGFGFRDGSAGVDLMEMD